MLGCILNVLPTRWWNRVPNLTTEFFLTGLSLSNNATQDFARKTQSIKCFQNFCLLSSELKRQRWERLGRDEKQELQGLGELNYVSQKPTGWTYNTHHACVPALLTGRCFHVCESAEGDAGSLP